MSRSSRRPVRAWMVLTALAAVVLVAAAFNVKVVSASDADTAASEGQLDPAAYAAERQTGEGFGDFVVRTGVVKATLHGLDFHA